MIKKTASRNQRSKSTKLKHVLQILLLFCICFWLLYQIKRSHDRKRDMLENDSKALVKGNDEGGGLNLGRKDLRAKHREEEDEEEGKDEDEGSQGDRDDVEVDEDDTRREIERNEELERGEGKKDDGDDESVEGEDSEREDEEDSNKVEEVEDEKQVDNEEGTEVESIDNEDDNLDEDKGRREESALDGGEEDIVEGREEKVREDNRSEDKDQDEVSENSHEAREVHYQADDASSAVAHNAEAGNGDADLGSSIMGTESNSTMSNPHSLILEATPGNQTDGQSNISEVVDNQASNVTASGGTELAGLVSNISENVTNLPEAGNLTTPASGNVEVSLEHGIVAKLSNASAADEKTVNISAVINSTNQTDTTAMTSKEESNSSYQTDTTPSTYNEESSRPVDPSNNQTIAVSDGSTGMDRKIETGDGSQASSSGDGNDNVIKMQLPDKQDGGSRTQ